MEALDWITIEGFKSIRKIENLPLNPINVLVGPNGSGKSNFIGTFSFLHAIRDGRLKNYVDRTGGAEQILHFGSKATPEIMLHISFAGETNQYKIKLAADDNLLLGKGKISAARRRTSSPFRWRSRDQQSEIKSRCTCVCSKPPR